MNEIRRNQGDARLANNATCCRCNASLVDADQYRVERAGRSTFYSCVVCLPHAPQAAQKPIPDIEMQPGNKKVLVYYRGAIYVISLVRATKWRIVHQGKGEALREVPKAGGWKQLLDWLRESR